MCGIVGYSGKQNSSKIVLEGLKTLEYRGYDSWGIAVQDKNQIKIFKEIGEIKTKLSMLPLPKTSCAIGHTRWATHGGVTMTNAHPHISTTKDFILAQNGIVENYTPLKNMLKKKNYKFKTQTDTEVIVRLIEQQTNKEDTFRDSVRGAFNMLEGRNTIIVLNSKQKENIIAVKNGSPLVLGIGKDELFLASDALAFTRYTKDVVFFDNLDLIEIKGNKFKIYDSRTGKEKKYKITKLNSKVEEVSKGKYDHFMLKEILEQKDTISKAVNYKLEEIKPLIEEMKKSNRIYITGAGTAGFASGQIAYFLRSISKVDILDIRPYDFTSYLPILKKDDLVIAVSQSGETADTIEVLEYAQEIGSTIACIVNVEGSTIHRMSEFKYLIHAGPEICVASTKVFTSQCVFGYLLAKSMVGEYTEAREEVESMSSELGEYFSEKTFEHIKGLVKKIRGRNHFFILGKDQNAYIALEGALKIKEISYKHFEGFSAGELKHGVIALIDKGTPVFTIISDDMCSKDLLSATEEVRARGAYTVGVGSSKFKGEECFDYFLPVVKGKGLSSIANVIPFQLLSYFLAVSLGNSVDKPRNLAKSVTVK
ncbi:glutamine--fructose-6-phosphate transaminase (isomerizing) [bacterium]|nr:glutamine--fructose-6-phosphate transaminase (isomerizing) [bacterium]